MPRRHGPGLSLAEWLVLCLVSQEPAHGFALAGLLARDGDVGMAWHVQKGVVCSQQHPYRGLRPRTPGRPDKTRAMPNGPAGCSG